MRRLPTAIADAEVDEIQALRRGLNAGAKFGETVTALAVSSIASGWGALTVRAVGSF